MEFLGLAEGRPPKRRKKNLGNSVEGGTLFGCLLVWQRAAPQSAENKISVILSKEARCFGVFWFGRGPPLESMTTNYNRKKCRRQSQSIRSAVKFKAYWSAFLVWLSNAATNKNQNKVAVASGLKTTSRFLCLFGPFLILKNDSTPC